MWKHWVNGVLGLWIVAMPYLQLGNQHANLMVVTGLVIAALSFWEVFGRKGSAMM